MKSIPAVMVFCVDVNPSFKENRDAVLVATACSIMKCIPTVIVFCVDINPSFDENRDDVFVAMPYSVMECILTLRVFCVRCANCSVQKMPWGLFWAKAEF